jgi:hypothetical protein
LNVGVTGCAAMPAYAKFLFIYLFLVKLPNYFHIISAVCEVNNCRGQWGEMKIISDEYILSL